MAAPALQEAGAEEVLKPTAKPLAGYLSRDLHGHKRRICALGWSGNGRRVASGSADSTIRIWNVEPHGNLARPERAEAELKGHSGSVSHLCWRPGHDYTLASVTGGEKTDKCIRVWDVKSNKCTASISSNTANLYVTWSPDGNNLAVIDQDNVLSLIDHRKGKAFKVHKLPHDIFEIHWGPTANHLLAACDKGTVDVLSLATMEVLWSFKGHSSIAYCFAISKNHKQLVSGGGDAVIALWDLEEQVCTHTWWHMNNAVRSLSLSHDSQMLAYATEGGELEVLSLTTKERLHDIKLRTPFSDSVAWSPTANVLAYCDECPDPTAPRDHRGIPAVGVVTIFAPGNKACQ